MARQKKSSSSTATATTQATDNSVYVALNRPLAIQFTMPDGRKVVIAGNADHLRGQEKGVLPVGGYGLTRVATADWEYIEKTYGGMEIFKNGLIFAHEKKGFAKAEAEERSELRNGLEPVEIKKGTAGQKTGEVREESAGVE